MIELNYGKMMNEKVKNTILIFVLGVVLGGSVAFFFVKDQALQEFDNIQQQNGQLLKIVSDYEANYQMLKIDYDSIKALTVTQEKSLLASNQALINSEKSLKVYRTREFLYLIIIVGLVIPILIK
jgi:nucleoid-associated protein YejK